MRKIAFIAANELHPWGGSEYLWGSAAEKLARSGVHVSVSAKNWPKPVPQVEHLRSIGCQVILRPQPSLLRRGLRNLFPGREYARHVRRLGEGADLIVISQGLNLDGLQWMEAARTNNYKYATIAQGTAELWWPDDDLIDRLAASYEEASAAYFVSEASLNMCRRQFATPLLRGRVVRNPFNVRYDARPAWPSGLPDELRLAYVARLDIAGKGHDLLIAVLCLPHWRDRNIHVSLVGSGPNERAVRRMISNFGLKNVQLDGFIEDVEQVWSKNHALVFPSRYEGMPLALVEAMLCGRPAIATDVGGVRELVRDNVNGFLAKAPTIELLDEAMNRAWENRHRLKQMGEQAAIDVRKFVSSDPAEDFVRELTALMDRA